MELASGDRTGVRNMASKKETRQKTQGREFLGVKAPFCIWTNSLDVFYSQLEIHTSHISFGTRQISKADKDESWPKNKCLYLLTKKGFLRN